MEVTNQLLVSFGYLITSPLSSSRMEKPNIYYTRARSALLHIYYLRSPLVDPVHQTINICEATLLFSTPCFAHNTGEQRDSSHEVKLELIDIKSSILLQRVSIY